MNTNRIDLPLDDSTIRKSPSKDGSTDKTTTTHTPSPSQPTKEMKDPLIDVGWEKTIVVLAFVLATGIVVALGVVNQKLEYAIIFAFALSAIAIFLFFIS